MIEIGEEIQRFERSVRVLSQAEGFQYPIQQTTTLKGGTHFLMRERHKRGIAALLHLFLLFLFESFQHYHFFCQILIFIFESILRKNSRA